MLTTTAEALPNLFLFPDAWLAIFSSSLRVFSFPLKLNWNFETALADTLF